MDANIQDQQQWLQQFQLFMYNVLAPLVPETPENPQRRINYVGQEAIILWLQAFTHETVDPEFNYEELELLGDRVLKTSFCDYLTQRFPGIKKGTLSLHEDTYMSKLYQRELSVKLGFQPWIRVRDTDISTNILEDVFESFVGALFRVSDMVEKRGMGYLNCFNLMVHLFNDVPIDPTRAIGKSKTQIKQMFEKMGWGTPIEREDRDTSSGGVSTVSILPTPQAIQYMRCSGTGINLRSPLGVGTANTKTGATATAYDRALEELFRVGVTHEWVQQEKDQRELSNPLIQNYVGPAQRRLQQEGYVRMRFCTPRTAVSAQNATVQLLGVNREGRESILASTVVPVKEMNEGKRQVLEKYIQGNAR